MIGTDSHEALLRTPLHALHVELGARMVPFAGYDMPVQFAGVMPEHLHTRAAAGLFDVSHMGQILIGGADYATIAAALETLIPVDIVGLKEGRQRYGVFTGPNGGILDDLMLANRGDHVLMVVNAACKAADLGHLRSYLDGLVVTEVTDRALLALQGPRAGEVLADILPASDTMRFMDVAVVPSDWGELWLSRSGYTGEDGFEISVLADRAEDFARRLLADDRVLPIGLGARDSLRLEAGLCLYGHDIDAATTPVEAGLGWAIQKVRRTGGDRAGGFPGADVILPQLSEGAPRTRVGLRPEGRAPMREGTAIHATAGDDAPVGHVTSGAFGPTVGGPVSMVLLPTELATPDRIVFGEVRGKRLPARVVTLPFVPANFKR